MTLRDVPRKRRWRVGLLIMAACSPVPVGCSFTPADRLPEASPPSPVDERDLYPGEGPLRSSPPTGYAIRRDQGAVFTDGWNHFLNFGDGPVTVLAVKVRLTGSGLRHTGTLIAGYDRRYALRQALDGFPPRERDLGPLSRAEGFVIPAEGGRPRKKGWELLLGFQVLQPGGRATRTHIEVTYRYDGRIITDRWVNAIAVCSPAKGPECPQEYAGTDGE
ncbi:hypothetical protein [Spongiactinospora sp. 9N601]|uniref:hypothetical protein n=1 Tax=Spongiactinospora sp. 9N601 TaxID=3375149 RepID=UPI003793FB5D